MNEYTDTARQASVSLHAQGLDLSHRALGLHFSGDWAIASDSDARVFGRLRWRGETSRASLQLAIQATGLAITLRGAQGQVLWGPALLTPRAAGRGEVWSTAEPAAA